MPIAEYPVEAGVETGIQYGLVFEELEAANAAHCDLIAWMRGEYSIPEMVRVIAWHRSHRMVKIHESDAEARASKQRAEAAR